MLVDDMPIATFATIPSPEPAAYTAQHPPRPGLPDPEPVRSQVFNVRLASSAGRQDAAGVLARRM